MIAVLSAHIMDKTLLIQEQYPELYCHLNEMYATLPNPGPAVISEISLKNWLDSLNSLVVKYAAIHPFNP